MPPRGRTGNKAKDTPDEESPEEKDIKWAKEKGLYEDFFIHANAEKIPGLKDVQRAKFNAMKIAFEPLGQSTVKDWKVTKKWYNDLLKNPKNWPKLVPGFELWAEATGYDPTKENGGIHFQNMLQFLLVDAGGPPKFDDKPYYDLKSKRGDGWYKEKQTQQFDGTVHSFNIQPKNYYQGAHHTPATQGLALEKVGGKIGVLSGTHRGFEQRLGFPGGVINSITENLTIGAPMYPGSRLNWLYHCFGALVSSNGAKHGASHGSANSFVTNGIHKNCSESTAGCTALGNSLAAIIGLYYYPGCDKYNWVATQKVNGKSYDIRMRMWNPNYKLLENKLLVKEPINPKWHPNLRHPSPKRPDYVGSHGAAEPGFFVPHVFLSKSALAATTPDVATPPQPLKQLMQQGGRVSAIVASIAPWVGTTEMREEVRPGTYPIVQHSGQTSTPNPNKEYLIEIHKHLGDVVRKPGHYKDDLCFGFNVPKAHYLYPQWETSGAVVVTKQLQGKHSATGTGFQPVPKWRGNVEWLDDSEKAEYKMRKIGNIDKDAVLNSTRLKLLIKVL